ncbi:MAG: hypothetical protein AAFX85_01840, partial [Pseudomonadota bacterium]
GLVMGCQPSYPEATGILIPDRGPYAVASTNLEVTADAADLDTEQMHAALLGRPSASGEVRFLPQLLRYPRDAWVIDVDVPDEAIYGPARNQRTNVVAFITFPTPAPKQPAPYEFPYEDGAYGVFEHMLAAGDAPRFANEDARYPLILLAHGSSAHGLYEVAHAHRLSSFGYIVVSITYGDDRFTEDGNLYGHPAFLRPLMTKAVLDAVLASETFGPHVDVDHIGITGHSFGGFTALAVTGGAVLGSPASVVDRRVRAAVAAAPWVASDHEGTRYFAFGEGYAGLRAIEVPVITFFGTKDTVTRADTILPATRQLGGASYVVELVDQPHVFDGGAWRDRNDWELLFYRAYLKGDARALGALKDTESMPSGSTDRQRFDYQRLRTP